MAQMGNQLDNLQSLTVINSNNIIRLPNFGISYIPPKKEPIVTNNTNNLLETLDFTNNNTLLPVNGNKKVNDDEDDFVSIEEDADKEIKPKESIHQAEMNLVNTLMKEYSVTSIVEEKKKAEEEKKKQEDEEKRKIEEEHQKKLEEAKPKKKLDDLFNLLGDLPQPEVKANTTQIEQQNSLTQPNETQEKKVDDDNDDFVSIEEENNEQPTINNNTQPIPEMIAPSNEVKEKKENTKDSLLGIDFNVLAPIESKPKPQINEKEEETNNVILPSHSQVEEKKVVSIDDFMSAFKIDDIPKPTTEAIINDQQKEENNKESMTINNNEDNIKKEEEDLNDDDFCEVEEESKDKNEEIVNDNNKEENIDKKEIIEVPNVNIPIVIDKEEEQKKENEEKKETIEEEHKPSILNLTPLDFLQEFKKEIDPNLITNENKKDEVKNEEDNQFEFVEEEENNNKAETNEEPKQKLSEKVLNHHFKSDNIKDKFIMNLSSIIETLNKEISKNIPLLKQLFPFSDKMKLTSDKISSNLKLVNYLNGVIYLLINYCKLIKTQNFIFEENQSYGQSFYTEVSSSIKKIAKGSNFSQIIRKEILEELEKEEQNQYTFNEKDNGCSICLQSLTKEGSTNVFGYDFHISCINLWLNLIESKSPFNLN